MQAAKNTQADSLWSSSGQGQSPKRGFTEFSSLGFEPRKSVRRAILTAIEKLTQLEMKDLWVLCPNYQFDLPKYAHYEGSVGRLFAVFSPVPKKRSSLMDSQHPSPNESNLLRLTGMLPAGQHTTISETRDIRCKG